MIEWAQLFLTAAIPLLIWWLDRQYRKKLKEAEEAFELMRKALVSESSRYDKLMDALKL